jgi:hypothetical protein
MKAKLTADMPRTAAFGRGRPLRGGRRGIAVIKFILRLIANG